MTTAVNLEMYLKSLQLGQNDIIYCFSIVQQKFSFSLEFIHEKLIQRYIYFDMIYRHRYSVEIQHVFVCLFVFRPTREFFTKMETSPLSIKICKFEP